MIRRRWTSSGRWWDHAHAVGVAAERTAGLAQCEGGAVRVVGPQGAAGAFDGRVARTGGGLRVGDAGGAGGGDFGAGGR